MRDWTHNLLPDEAQDMLRNAALADKYSREARALNPSHEAIHTDKAVARIKRMWPELFINEYARHPYQRVNFTQGAV